MDLKELLGDLFTEEIKAKIGEAQVFVFKKGEDVKLDGKEFIPKSRFNEVSEQSREYKSQLDELTKKLKDLEGAVKGNDELKTQIADLNAQNEAIRKESEAKVEEFRKREAVKRALIRDGAKDEDLLAGKLDMAAIKLDGEKLLGYADQVEALKKSHDWAFGKESVNGAPPGGGGKPPAGVKNPFSKEHFNLTEQMRLLKDDPKLAEQLRQQAGS